MKIKTTLLLLLIVGALAAQKCEKVFYKSKHNNRAILTADSTIKQTKHRIFLKKGSRAIYASLLYKDDITYLHMYSYHGGKMQIAKKFYLGQTIKMGVKFSGGGYNIITFDNNPDEVKIFGSYCWVNTTECGEELLNNLADSKILSVEVLNGFGGHKPKRVKIVNIKAWHAKGMSRMARCYREVLFE